MHMTRKKSHTLCDAERNRSCPRPLLFNLPPPVHTPTCSHHDTHVPVAGNSTPAARGIANDPPERGARQVKRNDDCEEVVAHEHHRRCLHRDVGAGGADGDAHVGLGQRGAVIDAVPNQRDDAALGRSVAAAAARATAPHLRGRTCSLSASGAGFAETRGAAGSSATRATACRRTVGSSVARDTARGKQRQEGVAQPTVTTAVVVCGCRLFCICLCVRLRRRIRCSCRRLPECFDRVALVSRRGVRHHAVRRDADVLRDGERDAPAARRFRPRLQQRCARRTGRDGALGWVLGVRTWQCRRSLRARAYRARRSSAMGSKPWDFKVFMEDQRSSMNGVWVCLGRTWRMMVPRRVRVLGGAGQMGR
eukprot:363218-Chlamydomonas_euryale.AAC.4